MNCPRGPKFPRCDHGVFLARRQSVLESTCCILKEVEIRYRNFKLRALPSDRGRQALRKPHQGSFY